jgi:hypothetical protein
VLVLVVGGSGPIGFCVEEQKNVMKKDCQTAILFYYGNSISSSEMNCEPDGQGFEKQTGCTWSKAGPVCCSRASKRLSERLALWLSQLVREDYNPGGVRFGID